MSPAGPAAGYVFRGQSVRYWVTGTGPPLVLLHGTPFSSHVWHRIAPLFSPVRTVYRFDLLGYGLSEKRDGQDVSLGVQNVLFGELLDHWGLCCPDVVAHDFGGATALRTLLLNARSYRSLTLIDPVALSPWGSPFVRHVRAHEAAFATLPAYLHEALLLAYLQNALHRALAAQELQPYLTPWRGEPGQAAFYRQIAQMDEKYTDEIAARLGEVRCPTQILWGLDDQWIAPATGRRLQSLIPGAQLHEIPNCGHLMQEDAPEAIVAAVLSFLC
jgi:pimeloyl-ACP methyl ester carboxylesterase